VSYKHTLLPHGTIVVFFNYKVTILYGLIQYFYQKLNCITHNFIKLRLLSYFCGRHMDVMVWMHDAGTTGQMVLNWSKTCFAYMELPVDAVEKCHKR
jgi:hypothetical protein